MNKRTSQEHSVISTVLLPIARVLRNRGYDPIQVMEDVGIDPAKIIRPDWRIPLQQFDSLLEHCVELTRDEAFGLHAGEELQPQALSGLGLGWLASDSVYEGLCRAVRFSRLVSSISDPRLIEGDEFIELQPWGADLIHKHCYTRQDFGVAMIVRMCQLNLGEFLSPVVIEMERPLPVNPEHWESLLACKVFFDCQQTSIKWSRADVQEKLPSGDPSLARINDEHAQAYIDSFVTDLLSRNVVHKIISRLPDGPPDQQQIASDLCVSNRTLQRKLKEEGTSYNDLLQDARMHLACKYLKYGHRSVVEVTYLLGFSEPSAFSRAFKRWTGESPAGYQAKTNGASISAIPAQGNARKFSGQGSTASL